MLWWAPQARALDGGCGHNNNVPHPAGGVSELAGVGCAVTHDLAHVMTLSRGHVHRHVVRHLPLHRDDAAVALRYCVNGCQGARSCREQTGKTLV